MVLIADAHAEDRHVLRLLLEGMGHAVVETSNAQDAFAEAQKNRPDLILSGILMPGADGFELCRQMQQDPDLRHVPFAFVTASYGAPQYEKFAKDVGAIRVLRKPLKPQELRIAIAELLSTRFVPNATQKLRRLDNATFHEHHAKVAISQLEAKVAEMERLARRYELLSKTNHAIVHNTSRDQLFPAICHIAVRHAGVRFASILLIDQEDRHPKVAAWHGEAVGPTDDLRTTVHELNVAGRGLIEKALHSGAPVVSNDFPEHSATIQCHDAARRAGIGAVAVYPFTESGSIGGTLALYASDPGFFSADILSTLEEMTAEVSFALTNYARSSAILRANQSVADALDYNRLLIATSPVGIITYKATGAAVSANEAAAKLIGGTVEQLQSLNYREIESWKTSGLLMLAEQSLASNRVVEQDIHMPCTTFGKDAWFTTRLIPFEYNSERHLLALFSDITERVRAEQALRDRDRLLSEAQRIAHIGSWHFDRNGQLVWSDEMYRIFGVSSDKFMPTAESLVSLTHPDDRAQMQAWIAACAAGQTAAEVRFRIVRSDSSVGFISGRCDLLYDAENSMPRRIGTMQDVTESMQARQALEEAEGKYRALVEQQSLVGIFMIAGETVLYNNPRADEIFGYEPGALAGRSIKEQIAEEDWPAIECELHRIMSGEILSTKLDFRGRRKDGREVVINAQATLANSGGQSILIGVMQDVTEQRLSERKVLEHVAQLEAAFMHTVEVATALSELRDPYTAGHEQRVAEIAVAIGAELGFDARRQQGLRVAGLLHDIGKMTIPLEILAKPGKLNAAEFALVKMHPRASYDVLKNVEFPWPVAQVALQHHERIDGSGYPQGLNGDAILFEARIITVADVIEAMASHRPYRPGHGLDKALAEIERGRGGAYDATVVDACLKLFRKKGYQLPQI